MLKELFFVVGLACALMFLGDFMTSCSKHHPHEPAPIHVHHDHEVVVIDTVFQICDTVDLTVEFIVIGDQSAPNIYHVFLNDVLVAMLVINETFAEPTEIFYTVTFLNIVFGEVITIRKIEGSRAEAIGSSIVDIKCSGGG